MNTAALTLPSLTSFIGTKQDIFEEYEAKSAELTELSMIETERKRKINERLAFLDCVQAPEVELILSEKFRTQSFIPVLDQFKSSLRQRLETYKLV